MVLGVDGVDALLGSPEWLEKRIRTESLLRGLKLASVRRLSEMLSEAEKAVKVDRRLKLRVDLQTLIVRERSKVAVALTALAEEVAAIRRLSLDPTAGTEAVRVSRHDTDEFIARTDRITEISEVLAAVVADAAAFRAAGKMNDEKDRLIAELDNEVDELVQVATVARDSLVVELGVVRACPRYGRKLVELQQEKHALIEWASFLELKLAEVERALEAGKRLDAVKAAAVAAKKGLEKSKRSLISAEALEKNALEDFADGTLSQEDVVKAKRKVSEAKALVEHCRFKHEQAVKELIAVRQAGFPELRCPSAFPKQDRFAEVPAVASADLGDLRIWAICGSGRSADSNAAGNRLRACTKWSCR